MGWCLGLGWVLGWMVGYGDDDCDVLIDGYECKNILVMLFVCIYTCLYYK